MKYIYKSDGRITEILFHYCTIKTTLHLNLLVHSIIVVWYLNCIQKVNSPDFGLKEMEIENHI